MDGKKSEPEKKNDCLRAVADSFIDGAVDPLGAGVGAVVAALDEARRGPAPGGTVEVEGKNMKLPPRGRVSPWILARRAAVKALPLGLAGSLIVGGIKATYTALTDKRCR